jgi:hypothetical protein
MEHGQGLLGFFSFRLADTSRLLSMPESRSEIVMDRVRGHPFPRLHPRRIVLFQFATRYSRRLSSLSRRLLGLTAIPAYANC